MSHLTKTETYLVILPNIVTTVARSVKVSTFCPHTCAKSSMPLVNYCIVNDGLVVVLEVIRYLGHVKKCNVMVNAMPNMQKMLLQFAILVYIKSSAIYKKIFNSNRKLKQQVSKKVN